MRKPNPSGRTRLLGESGRPIADSLPLAASTKTLPVEENRAAAPGTLPLRLKAKPHRADVPLSHGKHSQAQVDAWDAEGKRRREGNCAVPSWQLLLPHGCMGCLAPTGILPLEAGEARLRLEGRGWVFRGGMWLCAACAGEGV